MNKKLYTAIIFFIPGCNAVPVMKYKKITSIDRFTSFASSKYPNMISSINFYERESRDFVKQVRIATN